MGISGRILYASTCPECGNEDLLTEDEKDRDYVHCSRCYKHYVYMKLPSRSNVTKECLLCGWYDCECEDLLTEEEYNEMARRLRD